MGNDLEYSKADVKSMIEVKIWDNEKTGRQVFSVQKESWLEQRHWLKQTRRYCFKNDIAMQC